MVKQDCNLVELCGTDIILEMQQFRTLSRYISVMVLPEEILLKWHSSLSWGTHLEQVG